LDTITALLLGIVQGFTEFIPVSSSGHLVILQNLFTVDDSIKILFDIVVHVGTLFAVLFYYRDDIKKIILSYLTPPSTWKNSLKNDLFFRIGFFLILSTFVTALVGIPFIDFIQASLKSPKTVAVALFFTGFILFIVERFPAKTRDLSLFDWRDAIFIGLFQTLGLMPGISRSGITIVCALMLKFKKTESARYSFLLSVPAILGAFAFEFKHTLNTGLDHAFILPILLGLVSSAIAGVISIKLILYFLRKSKLYIFSIYCWILATVVLILAR